MAGEQTVTTSDWELFDYSANIKRRPTSKLQEEDQIPEGFAAFTGPLDTLEEVHKRIYDTQSIYHATGKDLDRFGEYVAERRQNRGDDEYRQAILQKRFTQGGSGTDADIQRLARAVTNYAEVTMVEHFPAAYMMHLSGPQIPSDINQILDRATVAGVRAYTTHDYGGGGFALSGLVKTAGNAMQTGDNQALKVGENAAMRIGGNEQYIGRSRLFTNRNMNGAEGYLVTADGSKFRVGGGDLFTADLDFGGTTGYARLCGAMPK